MRQIVVWIALSVLAGCSHHSPTEHQFSTTTPQHHEGIIAQDQLLDRYSPFAVEYQSYQPSLSDTARIDSITQPIEIFILFGTWCHDSQREVPRFLKLVNTIDHTNLQVTLYAVNINKTDAQGVALQHGLKYTPTFIVKRNGLEIGRIIEKPQQSLAQDLLTIIQG